MVMMVHLYVALFRIIFRPLASKHWCTPSSRSSRRIPRGVVWGKALIPRPAILDPSHWGWKMVSHRWQPLWISNPVTSKALKQLVSCGCANKYKLYIASAVCFALDVPPSAPVVTIATRTDLFIHRTYIHLQSIYTSGVILYVLYWL